MSGSHSVCLKDLTAMTFTLGQTVRNMVSTKKNRLSCYHSYASFKVKSSLSLLLLLKVSIDLHPTKLKETT